MERASCDDRTVVVSAVELEEGSWRVPGRGNRLRRAGVGAKARGCMRSRGCLARLLLLVELRRVVEERGRSFSTLAVELGRRDDGGGSFSFPSLCASPLFL
jgi:hypothetical protein